jgi:hypothetical protein
MLLHMPQLLVALTADIEMLIHHVNRKSAPVEFRILNLIIYRPSRRNITCIMKEDGTLQENDMLARSAKQNWEGVT